MAAAQAGAQIPDFQVHGTSQGTHHKRFPCPPFVPFPLPVLWPEGTRSAVAFGLSLWHLRSIF